MTRPDVNRRDFNRLTAAAFSGVVAGTMTGCGGTEDKPGDSPTGNSTGTDTPTTAAADPGKHVCRGLNDCKGLGQGGDNDCAGKGSCFTAPKHACGGQNECKGQGGCGDRPGANDCKEQGGCAVPLSGQMWDKARALFEERMKAEGKDVGDPPALPVDPPPGDDLGPTLNGPADPADPPPGDPAPAEPSPAKPDAVPSEPNIDSIDLPK